MGKGGAVGVKMAEDPALLLSLVPTLCTPRLVALCRPSRGQLVPLQHSLRLWTLCWSRSRGPEAQCEA